MVIRPLPATCSRHRPWLIDHIDGGGPALEEAPAAALDHLGRCDRCRRELEATALVITALRRLGDEAAATVPPPLTAVERAALRRRVEAGDLPTTAHRAAFARSPLVGAALAVVFSLPLVLSNAIVRPVAAPIIARPAVTPVARIYESGPGRVTPAILAAIAGQTALPGQAVQPRPAATARTTKALVLPAATDRSIPDAAPVAKTEVDSTATAHADDVPR
jgi:hypothetical protein